MSGIIPVALLTFGVTIMLCNTIAYAGRIIANAMKERQKKDYEEVQREEKLINAVRSLESLKPKHRPELYRATFDPAKIVSLVWVSCDWNYEQKEYDFSQRDEYLTKGYRIIYLTAYDSIDMYLVKEQE